MPDPVTAARLASGQTAPTIAVRVLGAGLLAVVTAVSARALHPEGFGAYAFIVALVTIASIPTTVGLRQTVARETAYATARGALTAIGSTWIWAVKWTLLVTVAMAGAVTGWALWAVDDPALARHMLIAAAILFLLPLPRMTAGVLQGLGKVALSQIPEQIVRPLVLLGLVLAAWWLAGGAPVTVSTMLVLFAIALAAEGGTSTLFLLRAMPFRLRDSLARGPDISRRALAMSAVSFGAIAGVYLVNSNLDVVMLGLLGSTAETGIYKAAATLSELVAFGLGAINTVLMPRIAGLHASGDRAALQRVVLRATWLISGFALVAALGLVLAGRPLLALVFGDGYAAGYAALIILVVGQLANALFGPVALILNMTGHERLTLAGHSLSVVANAVLNLALIPRLGIEGAAIATASSLLTWNLLLAIALKRRTGFYSTVLVPRAMR